MPYGALFRLASAKVEHFHPPVTVSKFNEGQAHYFFGDRLPVRLHKRDHGDIDNE